MKYTNVKKIVALLALVLFSQSAWTQTHTVYQKQMGSAFVPFVKNATKAETSYRDKADFDYIEAVAPLRPEMLKDIKPENIRELSLEEFNQLYARLPSGPMMNGEYAGFVMQKPPAFNALKKRVFKKVMASEDLSKIITGICGRQAEDCFVELLWSGKSFSDRNDMDQVRASTVINPVTAGIKVTADNQSWLNKGFIGKIVGGVQKFVSGATPGIFPMNTFCGISQVDTRRESIITDGAFGDDFGLPYYVSLRDQLVTRKGLNISEEYRMVRPGLYAGRVYLNKIFLFNVVIEKMGSISSDTNSSCEDSIKML